MKIGDHVIQTCDTAQLVAAGATGGFYAGIVVDLDDWQIVIARHSDRREICVPRRLFAGEPIRPAGS